MLKRIGVIGGSKKMRRELEAAAEGKGVAVVVREEGKDFPPDTTAVLAVNDAVGALEAALSLGGRGEDLLNLLAEAVDCRESFAPGTSVRVRDHVARFAKALGLGAEEGLVLERGALLRDVGKLRIPNEVLLKEGVLSYDEWTLLQRHTVIGAELVGGLEGLKDLVDVVGRHHECFDGNGYPDGLEGEEIPYLARVMKVVDVYCAMTSPRHYRDSHASHGEAIEHLKEERGKHFDRELVDVFLGKKIGREAKVGD